MEASLYFSSREIQIIYWMYIFAVFFSVSFTTKPLGVSAAGGDVTNGTDACTDTLLCEDPHTSMNSTQGSSSISIVSATSPVGFVPAGTTVDVVVCSRCLTDDSRDTITSLGLIVCVVTGSNNCTDCGKDNRTAVGTSNGSSLFSTWASAAMSDFKTEYRASPDNWHNTIVNSSQTTVFTIGSDSSCDPNEMSTYCNGPLPSDVDITLSVVKCSREGCTCLTFTGLFTTKARNVPTFNTIGFGIGLALGSGVVLTAIIMTLVLCTTDRNSKTKGDVHTHKEADQEDIDKEVGATQASPASSTSVPHCYSAAVGGEDVGTGCSDGGVSKFDDHQVNRESEDENEIVVVSEEGNVVINS